jgi:hypothetical protein
MNDNLRTPLLKRKRKENYKTANLIYKGQDVTSLLLRHVNDLTFDEKQKIKEFYTNIGRDRIEKGVVSNKIIPFAAHIFIDLDCDKSFWKNKHDFFVERNKKIKLLLDSIFRKIDTYSCESLTLTENFAVVLSSNLCIGCFSSGDVDLSADLNDKDEIIACLNEFNFYSKDQPKQIGEYSGQSMQFYNRDFFDEGFWINVIWKPVTRAFLIQDKYELRLSKDRILYKLITDTKIRVLNDTSLMYFCALHISAGHYFTLSPGLRLYVDIDRLARTCDINWGDIIKWEEEDDAGIRISTVLYLSYKLFNTPIPKIAYKRVLKNNRNKKLIKYLYNIKTNKIQNRSSRLRRLYVELVSDDRNIAFSFIIRIKKLIFCKLQVVSATRTDGTSSIC